MSIAENREAMLSKKTWVVIGATPDPDKFGYKIFKKLQHKGYQVYGVNPKYSDLEGTPLYSAIRELPEIPECVDMVVNPKLSLAALDDIHEAGIQYVWFQPGTYDEAVLEKAEALGLKVVYNDCVLVALRD